MKDASEIRISYNPCREKVEISGKVISPGGKERILQEQEKNIMDAPWNASAPRYPGGKILVANLPGVEINSEIEVKIKRIVKGPVFSKTLTFAGYSPIVQMTRIIDMPERIHLRHSPLPPGVEFREDRSGSRRICTWTARNIRRIPSERNQAHFRHFVPTVLISAGDWKNTAIKTNGALQYLSSPDRNPQTAGLAARLLAGLPGKSGTKEYTIAKVAVLRDFAAKNIRSAGPGLNDLPLSKLSSADTVLKSGYGNSADRAVFLGALLRAAGIDAEYILLSDLLSTHETVRLLERYPQNIFKDILIYVPAAGIYLNDTSQYAEPGSVNSANRIGLVLKNSRVESIHPALKHESRIDRTVKIKIHENNSADITVTDKYSGSFFESANRRYAELTPELRKRHFAELASNLSRAAAITGTPVTDFSKYPGETVYTLHFPGFVTAAGEYREFDLPFFKMFSNIAGSVKKNRKTPFLRKDAMGLAIRYEISYPARYTLSTSRPARLRLGDHAIGSFRQDCIIGKGKLDMTCSIKVPTGIIPAVDCDRLFTFRHQLARPNAGKIVLIPPGEKKK